MRPPRHVRAQLGQPAEYRRPLRVSRNFPAIAAATMSAFFRICALDKARCDEEMPDAALSPNFESLPDDAMAPLPEDSLATQAEDSMAAQQPEIAATTSTTQQRDELMIQLEKSILTQFGGLAASPPEDSTTPPEDAIATHTQDATEMPEDAAPLLIDVSTAPLLDDSLPINWESFDARKSAI